MKNNHYNTTSKIKCNPAFLLQILSQNFDLGACQKFFFFFCSVKNVRVGKKLGLEKKVRVRKQVRVRKKVRVRKQVRVRKKVRVRKQARVRKKLGLEKS